MADYGFGETAADVPVNEELTNAAFFPAIGTSRFYLDYRIPPELPVGMVKEHLMLAMIDANSGLKSFAAENTGRGIAKLADLPGDIIGGVTAKVRLYERAVYCIAKASLLKETQTIDRKPAAENMAKNSEETENKYQELAAIALRQLTGHTKIGVAII